MANWYEDSLFLLHYDHPFTPVDNPPALTGFQPEQVRRLLGEVRPDAVQYLAKGPAGYVPYPSRFGNQVPSVAEGAPDLLMHLREITVELGIRLVLGYSGLVDHRAADERYEWQRLRSNNSPYPNRALCPNTGYVEELMLPQLEELLDRYQPDGIWTDSENWSVSPCYCAVCESEYRMLRGEPAPTEPRDPRWGDWLQFHRDSFQRYVGRVARYLQERNPGLVYATNGGYATHQPEPAAEGVTRFTRDLSPAFSVRQASLEARFLDARGARFDLMTWNRCSARPWGGGAGAPPPLPAYPKSFEHLAQEGAAILANGGRWTVWMTPYPDDALPESEHGEVARAAAFARERAPWCHDTESGAYVAVLHSDATHRAAGNGLYDPGPSLDRIRGAHQALLEIHHPHDVVTETALLAVLQADVDWYRVLILPEQVALPVELEEPIAAWVRRGGRLIASGRVAPRLVDAVPAFGLEEVLGVRWTGRREPEGFVLHRGLPLRVGAPVWHVRPEGAEVLRPLLASGLEHRLEDAGHPAITRHAVGEGAAYYIAADLFTAYHRAQYPGLREVLREVLESALPEPPLMTTAPPTVEIALRRKGERVLVHFVNHAAGKSQAQNSAFIEEVPSTAPFSLTLALPQRPSAVRLEPGDGDVEWSYSEGTLTAFIPPLHLHAVLAIDVEDEPPAVESADETAASEPRAGASEPPAADPGRVPDAAA